MSRSTISTFQLLQRFPTEESARIHIEALRWPNGAVCPTCQGADRITPRKNGFYRCNACKFDFTVRTGTVFGRSHIPLHKWVYAMYMLMTARKGISSMQLAKQLGIRQASAWFMLGRLREACGNDLTTLCGIVEIDETYIGGKIKNKHKSKRDATGRGTVDKTPVIGIRERGGRTKAKVVEFVDASTLQAAVAENIELGSMLHTDEHAGYRCMTDAGYKHETVNHRSGEYVREGVTTNGVESVWAVLKRGLHGVYHHVSEKHLHRYVNEFTFRLNDGDVKRHTLERLDSLMAASFGQRITYAEMTA